MGHQGAAGNVTSELDAVVQQGTADMNDPAFSSSSIHRVSTGTMPGSVVDRARHVHPRPGLVVIDDGLPRLHSASAGTGRRTTDTEFVGLDGRGSGGMAKQPPERSP